MVSLDIPTDVDLLVDIGVVSRWGHPISSRVFLITSTSFVLINKAPVSASAAEDTKSFRIDTTANIVPLCMFGLLASD